MNKLLTSLTVSMALLAAGPAIAQQSQQQGQEQGGSAMQGQQSAQANFDDAELEKFVSAQEGINEIRDEYMTKIESAESQEEAQKLQQEANEEMVGTIEGEDLDIETYNEIATAYNSDPETRERVDSMM
ncbi:DUF4168 domain-containing protein [Marinobacter sp.]|uniref:DUF4168 domain-containing protein n=1 Tax=Marinobacter sp. TaxID=50741 RepID=UPI00356B2F5B